MFQKFEFVKPHVLQNLEIEEMEVVKRIRECLRFSFGPFSKVSRADIDIDKSTFIHLDIGGEGYNEHMGVFSGFVNSINVNAIEYQSNNYGVRIPNLVKVNNWVTDPSYPFDDGFADYITMQNAPLTSKNIDEIARCLKPGGVVELWIDEVFKEEMVLLAEKLCSKVEYDVVDEFGGSTASSKVRIISGLSQSKDNTQETASSSKRSDASRQKDNFVLTNLIYSATTVTFFNSVYRDSQTKRIEYFSSSVSKHY